MAPASQREAAPRTESNTNAISRQPEAETAPRETRQPTVVYPSPPSHYQPYAPHTNSSTIALAITAGTVLGVTAAAAVRWLNGGDFVLFPPAIVDEQEGEDDTATFLAGMRTRNIRNESVDDLVERVQNQTNRQQQAVDKLQAVVDHLEQQQTAEVSSSGQPDVTTILHTIRDNLAGIHDELRLRPFGRGSTCEDRLVTTLDSLDITLRQLQTLGLHKESQDDTSSPPHSPLSASFSRTPIRISTDSTTLVATATAENTTVLSTRQALCTALCTLVHCNDDTATLRIGAQLLYLYVVNVQRNPRVPRYRRIYTANDSFQQSVAPLEQVGALLQAVGFVLQNEEDTTCGDGAFWEWLPPTVHANKDGNTTAIEPSPKQAWLSDSEAIYLERLKEAEQALGVLKVWSSNNNHTDDPLTAALQAAGYPPPPLSPPPGTSILSPPDTKKHSSLASPTGFTEEPSPPMHPLLAVAATTTNEKSLDDAIHDPYGDDTGVVTPLAQSDNHGGEDNATDDVWK